MDRVECSIKKTAPITNANIISKVLKRNKIFVKKVGLLLLLFKPAIN